MTLWIFVLLGVYLVGILVIGFRAGRATRDAPESFYVADRTLNWQQEGLSVFSSAATGAALLGTIGQFYALKGSFLGYAVGYAVLAPALYWVVGSRFRRIGAAHGYQTQAELLGHYFRSRPLAYVASGFSMAMLMVYSSTLPIAVSSVMATYTGLDYSVGVVVFLVIALSYTLYGGLRAVAQTDVFHGWLLLAFLVLLVGALIWVAGGPGLFAEPGSRPYLTIPSTSDGLLVFLPWAVSVAFSVVSLPDRSHRMFSARSDGQLRRAVVLMGATLGFTSVVFLLSGMALNKLVPGVTNTDTAILRGLEGHVPWLVPLFVMSVWGASIAAASMHMLTVANVFMRDIYTPLTRRSGRPAADPGRRDVQVGRLLMVLTAVVALLVSIGRPTLIFTIVGVTLGLFSQFGLVYILTLFWKRLTQPGVWAGLAVGLSLTLLWQYVLPSPFGMQQPSVLALVVNAVVAVVVSLLAPGRGAGARAADQEQAVTSRPPGHPGGWRSVQA